ncbi:MAG: hypothetical protein KDK34_15770, partial [Leptospiraceae bacterium]|nr:hypothetical protein [Leptospiraceae bacterium]
VHVLVTRTSWDNIQGWPFFIPGYIPGNTMHFHSGYADCGKRFRRQQHFDHFPKDFDDMMSTREFHSFQPGDSFNIGAVKVRTRLINDPGNAIAYRLETDSGVAVFAPDAGFPSDLLEEQIVAQKDFFEAADLLVMGARYEREDGIQKYNTGWSYASAVETTVRCALQWKARRLVMIQHEPEHLDQSIETLSGRARECLEQHGPGKMEIVVGAEGQSFEV